MQKKKKKKEIHETGSQPVPSRLHSYQFCSMPAGLIWLYFGSPAVNELQDFLHLQFAQFEILREDFFRELNEQIAVDLLGHEEHDDVLRQPDEPQGLGHLFDRESRQVGGWLPRGPVAAGAGGQLQVDWRREGVGRREEVRRALLDEVRVLGQVRRPGLGGFLSTVDLKGQRRGVRGRFLFQRPRGPGGQGGAGAALLGRPARQAPVARALQAVAGRLGTARGLRGARPGRAGGQLAAVQLEGGRAVSLGRARCLLSGVTVAAARIQQEVAPGVGLRRSGVMVWPREPGGQGFRSGAAARGLGVHGICLHSVTRVAGHGSALGGTRLTFSDAA